jgi:hypothetical protein
MRINIKILLVFIFLFVTIKFMAISGNKDFSLLELIKTSDLIVKGKVVSINSYEKTKGCIYSDISFLITTVYKGKSIENTEILLTFIGGTIGNITQYASEHPIFSKNEESILFLKEFTEFKKYGIVGLSLGKFNIETDNASTFVLRDKSVNNEMIFSVLNNTRVLSNKKQVNFQEFIQYIQNNINN